MKLLDKVMPAAETPWADPPTRRLFQAFVDDGQDDDLEGRDPITVGKIAQLAVMYLAWWRHSEIHGGIPGVKLSVGVPVARRVVTLATRVLDTHPILDAAALARLVHAAGDAGQYSPTPIILDAVERFLRGKPPRSALREALVDNRGGQPRGIRLRIDAIVGGGAAAAKESGTVEQVDAWTIALDGALGRMPAARRGAVKALLAHAALATQTAPTKKWLAASEPLVAAIGKKEHTALLSTLLAAIGTPAPFQIEMLEYEGRHRGDPRLVHDRYTDLLRGLIWSAMAGDTAALTVPIGDCAERCFKKLPGHGPLQPKIGNACLAVLGRAPSDAAIGQLTRLKSRAKHASVRRLLDKAVGSASERTGLTPEELEEVGAPTCGLDELGRRVVDLPGGRGELRIGGAAGVELLLSGKPTGPKLAELKQAYKELAGVVPAQRVRLERMLLSSRTLPYPAWRERYADHLLVGALARRLIWWIGDRLASFDGAKLVGVDGKKFTAGKRDEVRLWHPFESKPKVVGAWRAWLDAHGVTQPFKQAHREVYALTPAERRTRTYSNRFAAHILRQHQLAALLRERGWRYTLQGNWDSHNTPYCELPGGWTVAFHVEPVDEPETSGAGIYTVVGTDRVVFRRTDPDDGADLVRLADLPPLVFSEAMRDIDLFVGVASIGADPGWQNGGRERDDRHGPYWRRFAFGDGGESARTRHEALARLVPRLAIAGQCKLTPRFLEVRGRLRTYRIHLGSAATVMADNSEYLCILPDPAKRRPTIQLPFEGDMRLSEILSKAILLAADDTIEDRAITRQIRGE